MKYIITGGAGFIGSHIAEELVKDDNEVVVIDSLYDGKKENLNGFFDKVKFVKEDIRNEEVLKKEFKDADFVLHQAARRSVPQSLLEPKEYNDVNINGTLAILEAARARDVKRVVLASSSSVYGDIDVMPEKETFSPDPLSPYALSKLAGEHYLKIFFKLYGLETVSLRYFNVFGQRQDPASEYAAVIPLFIKLIGNDKQPTIFGDGKQTRDFTFVKNVVEGNLLACQAKKAAGEVFNLADGEAISVNQLVEKINVLLEKDIKPTYTDIRQGDVKHTLADPTKAREILGYKGKFKLDEGLKITADWVLNN
ncbi:SDR family oxidoreductase [Nanoarchaeota archaeon]